MDRKVSSEYTKILIAQYLDDQGYQESLVNFLRESHLPRKALLQKNSENLETILDERIKFVEQEVANKLNQLTLNEPVDIPHLPLVSWDYGLQFKELEINDCVVDMAVDAKVGSERLLLSTSNREVKVYDTEMLTLSSLFEGTKTSGLLRPCGSFGHTGYHYACGLDGMLNIYDSKGGSPLFCHKIHRRVTSHAHVCTLNNQGWYLVSCGLDNKVKVHRIQLDPFSIELWAECTIPSACSALQVSINQSKIMAYLAQTEFTHVTCYEIDTIIPNLEQKYQLALNGAQFTPHAFQVRDMKYLSGENTLLVATSHIPYMRLLVVEIPQEKKQSGLFYDKVIRDLATEVPQDNYSQPLLGILPRNSGVIVSGNEGIYAIDIAKGDSWHITTFPKGRVKCLDINESNGLIAIGFADKRIYIARTVMKN